MMPVRRGRKRTPGWRAPAGAVYVGRGRGCRWGNPYEHDGTLTGRIQAAVKFNDFLQQRRSPPAGWINPYPGYPSDEQIRTHLTGHDLLCWCHEGDPCHGDVLIATAQPRTTTAPVRQPDGSTTVTMQRCCNGCGREIGDATGYEIAIAAVDLPLPDVRTQCPACSTPPTVLLPATTGVAYEDGPEVSV